MNEITVSMEEYKDLVKAKTRIEIFAEYIKKEGYSVTTERCAQFLGVELEKKNDD